MQCHGILASLVLLLVFSFVIISSWLPIVSAVIKDSGLLVLLTASKSFMGLSGGVVAPSGLVGLFRLGVSSLGMLSISSSLSASLVSSFVFNCQHGMVHGLDWVHLQVSTLHAFQTLQGLKHECGPHVCRPQISSCIMIDSSSFRGASPLMSFYGGAQVLFFPFL